MYAYDLNSSEYKKMLQKYDLKPQSFYFSIPAPAEVETFFLNLEREFQFVAEMDVTRVTLQGTYDRPQVMGEKEKEYNLSNMIRFAKLAKTFGLTTNAQLAKAKAEYYGIEKCYGSVAELLADPEIDAVHNCTPNFLHLAINKEIIKSGKHPLSEKPLCTTYEEAAELVELKKPH